MRALFQTLLLLALCAAFSTKAQGKRTDSFGAKTTLARGRMATRADGVGTVTYGYDQNSKETKGELFTPAQREQMVLDRLKNNRIWNSLNDKERDWSLQYPSTR